MFFNTSNVLSSTSLLWSYHYYHHYSHACLFVVHWFWSTFLWCFLASLQYLVYCLNLVYYLMPSGWFIWGRRRAHGMQLWFACILNVEAKESKQRWLIFILSTQYVLIWICILQQSSQASWHHYYILTALFIGYRLFKGDEGVDLRLLACSRVEGSHWKCEVCVSINLTCANGRKEKSQHAPRFIYSQHLHAFTFSICRWFLCTLQ